MNPLRRGACPGIANPMVTGDGLLARLPPSGPLPVSDFAAVCDWAMAYGNGVIEVTQRGSLQVRGLSVTSAPLFARNVSALALGGLYPPRLLASPLMGLDAHERCDLRPVLAELRAALTERPALASLGPKVSVLLDGGGAVNLDRVSGDIRLRVGCDDHLQVSIAGDAATAIPLGVIEPQHAPEVVLHVLTAIASRGASARARGHANAADIASLRSVLTPLLLDVARALAPRAPSQPIGKHRLNDGHLALGVGLEFGYTEAATLRRLTQLAAEHGANSMETARGRALLVIGLDVSAGRDLAAAASAHGFVVRPDDPRRFVVACAGAPACGSAKLATRQAAPAITQAAAALLDGSFNIHVSGCAKGCAHPGAAAMTFVGPNYLVLQGRAGDPPHAALSMDQTIAGLAELDTLRRRGSNASATSAQLLSALGTNGMLAALSPGQ